MIGCRVMGLWTNNSWYPGYVAEANANETLFFVQFDDGDTRWLPPAQIRPGRDRPAAAPEPRLTPGTPVEGEWSEGSWYPGVVARANHNSTLFFIQFDDGDQKWLPAHQLRYTVTAPATAARPAAAPAFGAPAVSAPAAADVRCAYCNTRLTRTDLSRCLECGARL